MRTLTGLIKRYWKKIDWDVVQILIIVGIVPIMIVIGGLFFWFFTPYYTKGL